MRRDEWSKEVKKRDNFDCVICGEAGQHAHHIQPVAYTPEKMTLLSNGVTLCQQCHRFAHRNWTGAYGGHKYDVFRSFKELQNRAIGDKSRIAAALVVGDAINTAKAYKSAGNMEKYNQEWVDINRFCELLNCQPGDILEYKKETE